MTNFKFLNSEWPSIYAKMKKAEERIYVEPTSTAFNCRLVLEEIVNRIYDKEFLEMPFNTDLYNLLEGKEFAGIVPFSYRSSLRIVRKTGNNAVHYGKKVNSKDALVSVKYLFSFLKWFAQSYNETIPTLPAHFDESLIPKLGSEQRRLKEIKEENRKAEEELKAQIEKLLQEKEAILEKANESAATLEKHKQEVALQKQALRQQKEQRKPEITSEFTEAETRKHLIDIDLKVVGWDNLRNGRELEFAVTNMPVTADNPKGNGYADYVLWDDNGLPLAVIEAKRTSKDIEVGKHQASLYADSLEIMFDQRPIIFYTNGYEIKIWNDTFYSTPRRVYGFYSKEELQWLIQQRKNRKDIRKANVNAGIAGRPYQLEAIKRVAESFVVDGENGRLRGDKREALLVMATGSGKTRTAAALVDIFLKSNWVKRVLFLADRNALVRQAKNSFGDHLPDLSSIDLTEEKENNSTRLVFSTYPSMMNRIDNVRNEDERFYGVGHFDMIIVDEAHRSVYNRYKAIFDYFDAMVVGLTATPKDSIDHNTYELFGCSNEDPTFAYELDEAVPTYLKSFRNLDVSTEFLRKGIKYSELSDEEKEIYEDTFEDKQTGLFPEEISANAMNKWLFNKDTVNKVLDTLMDKGLKIEGGDKIGRTIIFAVNQKHADFIVTCFTQRYPEKHAGFIEVIHNKVSHAQSLIDAFCDQYVENNPQIVVSVDMMDTGIDAPRVLNLVFFKVVRSYAKFWQMIGRGTRLCPDVYGPGRPKEEFLVFDVCQNFEFFDVNKKGYELTGGKSITQQIFEARLSVSKLLVETGSNENLELSKRTVDILHSSISGLDRKRFTVGMNLRYVDEFTPRERWNSLSSDDINIIEEHLSELPLPDSPDEVARRFDLMMLKLQHANLLSLNTETGFHERLMNIGDGLSKKYSIPQVLNHKRTIEDLKNPEFYENLTQVKINRIREDIRELVKYLERESQVIVYTDIKDSNAVVKEPDLRDTYGKGHELYRRRVESFVRENAHQLTISKLSSNQPITEQELELLEGILFNKDKFGTKEDFKKEFGNQPLGKFIRSIIGLSSEAANEAFSEFILLDSLKPDQITFINTIIGHLTKNGTIDKKMLFETPFTDVNDQGLVGVFDERDVVKIVSIIDEVNNNANVG